MQLHVQYAGMTGTLLIVLQRMSGWHYWRTDCRAPLFEIAEESYRYGFSVEQVRSSDPPFSRSALRLCPIGGASQAAPVVERWLLLGPRRQGEDDPHCSLAWAPLPSPSPPPSLTGCERCAVVGGDVCVLGFGCGLASGFGCGLARECVRLPPVERVAAASGSQGAASESAAGSGRLRGCGR